MHKSMADKVIIVTGAGSVGEGWGNGKAAAALYAREGGKILAVDRSIDAARQTQEIIRSEGGICEVIAADVSKSADVQAIADAAMDHFGRVDVLHNNVGIAETGGPVETSEESWNRLVAVNQTSLFLTHKYVLPIMERQKNGAIVNISSLAAIRWIGFPYLGYTTTKAAILAFTKNVAMQYAPMGIRANCVLPGLMDTPMIREPLKASYGGNVEEMRAKRDAQCPMGFMGDAWDVAHASLFLASDNARYITGMDLIVDGGLSLKVA
ncbi:MULTISPECIES: SDR family NAD(P)-dependent oxidoreductase [unclassified Herbaspirillum]|uniref:SDR family NAD(P)-dependent oxidoreductase n=1 Tax=unclassified Herbaspirillum TaxID=2624150 RepID=UPI000E2F0845|nr:MULTISPECIES: SDR family NAD(P)-dependent oxidoreductase [unclassified Herbaspirillum]RFB70852.1 SDR family oxidoreductase [Herbaspirillum sp. 3R-3a1]TFI08624.1 SDR family oxidoreductase [Herbaspirillum sp. 3R11]TFI15039.1 SDR family oxidoreductase [Herbaspirillum sp. 3R-11]TFI29772.1 SDR family oxidoreductase [Herbaspirillum sp. 3C11]